ncbi:MAG: ABC transporter ATP-binding protein [Bacteroidales bacterium]|nr:ABC transporter ATP-binding protein/permease [Bacteroidales bacterium]
MSKNRFILKSFRLFFEYKPIKIVTLFLITLFQGFSQGITILLLIPMLGLLDPSHSSEKSSKWTDMWRMVMEKTGMETTLGVVLATFACCMVAVAILQYVQSTMQSTYQQGFSYEMRKRLFRKIIDSDWTFLNGRSKHNHIQVLTTEIPKMTTYYYYYLGLASKLLFIAAHVILAFLVSFQFTLLVAVSGLLTLAVLNRWLKKTEQLGSANIQAFRRLLKRIDDFWLTVKIAKIHHSENFYFQKYDESNKQMLDYQNAQVRNRNIPQLLFFLVGILILILVVYLSYSVVHLPLTTLFVLILLFARIFPQFSGINSDLNMLVSNQASVRMVLDMDREMKDSEMEPETTSSVIEIHDRIEIRNLSFSYQAKHPIFDHFSATIPANKMTGIVGKSGSGKTTLLDIITGLQQPETPSIYIDGLPLMKERLSAWKHALGYLPQDSFFVDGTLRENLIWDASTQPTDEEILRVLASVKAEHLITSQPNGLNTNISNYQYHFSGGERQRLALARVLLRKPLLLLLDESTSALDPDTERSIMECLANLKKELTIVFVTHRSYLSEYFDAKIEISS